MSPEVHLIGLIATLDGDESIIDGSLHKGDIDHGLGLVLLGNGDGGALGNAVPGVDASRARRILDNAATRESRSRSRSSSVLPISINEAQSGSMNAAGLAFLARSTPPRAGASRFPSAPGTSSNVTGIPADAASAAMPLPIVPAPTTPSPRVRKVPREKAGIWRKYSCI